METHFCDYSKISVSLRQFPEMERGTTEPIITIYANYTIYATSFGPSSRKPIPFTSTSSPSTPSTPRLLSQILLHTKNGLHRHLSMPSNLLLHTSTSSNVLQYAPAPPYTKRTPFHLRHQIYLVDALRRN